ncbi:MAG: ornithine cyclodeaminase family protein [Rubrivivax sp.]
MDVRILNREHIAQVFSMRECVDLMHKAFTLVSQGKALQPIRRSVPLPHGRGLVSVMPGHASDPAAFGVKVVSVYPGNHGTAHGSHQGAVLLFDDETGALRAVLDGRDITAIRTGATSAAATDVLARKDAKTMTIYGYGDEARTHLQSLTLVRPFDRIVICGRSLAKAKAFAGEMGEQLGRKLEASDDFQGAAHADVLCTVTSATAPFLKGEWVQPGTHVNVVGSSIPTTAEVDDEMVRRSRFFTDFTDSTLELGGEIRGAISQGVVAQSHIIGCVGDVITGKVAGRQSAQDITLFKSLGMVVEDLVSCSFIVQRAEQQGVGVLVPW